MADRVIDPRILDRPCHEPSPLFAYDTDGITGEVVDPDRDRHVVSRRRDEVLTAVEVA